LQWIAVDFRCLWFAFRLWRWEWIAKKVNRLALWFSVNVEVDVDQPFTFKQFERMLELISYR
jgi:hypothetical protein